MHARKLLCLLLSALLAVTLLAACGGSNFSKDAMAAVNAIQDTIEFETDSQLTKALREAIESGGDVRTTLLQKLGYSDALTLTAGGLRAAKAGQHALAIYSITGDDPDDAAQTAADYIKNILDSLSGGQYTGKIAMIQIDGVYYIAVDVTVVEPAPSGGSEDDGDDDPTPDPGYYQTSHNSYVVTTNEGFAALVDEKLSSDELEATNITLDCDVTIPANWPYGMTYSGTFDGQDHTISGLVYNDNSDYFSGMFGTLTGTVKDCNFADVSINGGTYTGTVAGFNDGGHIENCSVLSGHVVGTDLTGGITGNNSGTISDCNVAVAINATVTGTYTATGGIASQNAPTGSITGCYVSGNVSSTGRTVGGIVGSNFGNISDSYATGTITGTMVVGGIVGDNSSSVEACYATGSINGTNTVGGVAAINFGTLNACYSSATVTCAGTGFFGGIVANNAGNVTSCYSTGAITGATPSDEYGGGLSGTNSGTITACYTTSSISTQSPSTTGALVGSNNAGFLHTCYWSNSLDEPYGVDTGQSNETGKIGTSLTWEQATQNMNAVSGSSIQFVYHNDGQAPTLPI